LQTLDATPRSAPQHPSEGRLTPRTYEGPLCLHELIEEQAERTPDRVAVSFEDTSLTYRELLDRAGCLARHLVGMGVGPDVRVGVCAERSLEMVVGLLGVLRAGGAYVPLDPSYPAERLAFMVEDAAAPVVLTQRRLAGLLPAHGAQTVLLDVPQDWQDTALLPRVPPDALAYVIYTSGSTGRPKGAMNAHRGVRNRLLWMRNDFGLGPDEVVLQKTPFSFDLSVWEIFATLMTGARLVMARPGGHQDSAYLVEVMEREGITIAHFVPSMLRAFLSAPGLERCTALRRVLCTGEAVSEDLERRFFERFSIGGGDGPELYNLYGPTEAAVEVTWWQCGPGRSGPVPIGRPLPNTSIHLVDSELHPVPPDGEGELLIGGIQPARGYHGRPDLTAERFIPDPFGEAGSRLYRTGDLARYRAGGPDGVIDFLGRIDFQVKVRGHRIELGEIEAGLGSHRAVHEAVVVARERNGELRLVAYVVPKPHIPVEKTVLRAHLATSLPDYMVPAEWVFLEAFPLTTSGKIDRKALPEPERVRVEHVPPRTPLERFLAALWEETLAVERIGLRDSFFDLGGTSLTGAVVINRLQGTMGEILHVVALFDAPTLAELAAYLGREHRAAVARVWGEDSLPEDLAEAGDTERVEEARLAELRALVQPLAPFPSGEAKNPPVLFVLAPPRSGTTLMRVMLGGHPGLFSPPELELLTFNTMDERRAAFSGRDSFWLEGVLRAVMEARGCTLDEARDLVEACERGGWTVRRFYGQLQEWLGDRLLVDKSTNYPLDPEVLRRAEETFESPFYLHLVRHPYGMIHSFEEAKIDQVFFRRPHSFARRELAELIWTVSQRNILAFLETVPAHRQHRLLFEDLVRDPEGELRRLCAALGTEYHPDMADPYKEKRSRMTDGLHAEGRMLGDMKFHEHRGVDAGTAERWRQAYTEDFLGEPTWAAAVALGYSRSAPDAVVPLPRTGPLPLSPAQERLWFLDRLVPGSPVYNSCREVRLRGPLDVPSLAAALDGIVRRHEALRTVFAEVEDGPVQVILPALSVGLPVVDLAGLPGPVRRAEARRLARETARQPFELSRGPLLRAALLRLEAEEHALRLDVHHIATDGWSMVLLQRELEALYRAELLPALPVQYADYAVWQRRWLEREGPAQLAAWSRRLEGLPPALELPADRPRPAVQGLDGALERMALPAELAGRLEEVGRNGGATLFMVLLAGFQVWLHRITGREDLAVGVPSANRGRAEIEKLIGFFVNNLVIRADLSGDPSFAEALSRVREAALFAYSHPDLPFEKLVAELAPDRDLSRPPIYQVAFSLQDPPPALDLGGGLRGEMSDVHTGTAKFDLWLQVDRDLAWGNTLEWSLRAEYATALFDAATVRRWLGHLRVLLEGIAVHPESRLSDLPLLSHEECEQLVVWNRTSADIPAEPVHRLFRRWAERAPSALAISWEGGSLTYGELAGRVDLLAEQLRELGVGPETVVALCLERSPELLTAVLGVLEAGGAYLPIDPAHPEERRAWIVADSGAAVVVRKGHQGHQGLQGQQGGPDRAFVFEVLDVPGVLGVLSGPDLAYVIYTSGSTGMPKGTELRHHGLSSLIAWHRRTYGLRPADRTTMLAGPGFDASVWETWAPLTAGASLHIPPPDTVLSPPALLDWMVEHGITVAFLPTPLAEAVLSEQLPGGLALRLLLTGGDRLRRRPAPGLPFALVNHYGPTEATVVATAGVVSPDGERAPEIGKPIANTRVYLLDRNLRPVPVGVAGELCLAGEGLARGYRGRPDLTAERFVPDPFAEGRRLYRTGDLARWATSGAIEFVGRVDHQVKIRGYRIELGEIEAALGRHPEVREAVVLALDGRLVAFVVGQEVEDLRPFLARRLPDAMIPAGWVFLESLPLTTNGKVDRRALAGMAPAGTVHEEAEPPRAGLETELAAVWTDLFGVSVSRQDDFFALGGHSLLAARLAFRVRERLGVDLPLRAVFETPTLSALAARIQAEGRATDDLPLVAGAPRPTPASFAQQRLWFLDRLQPGSPAFNMPFVLRFAGPLRAGALGSSLAEVVRRHETLRTSLALPSGEMEPVQIVAPPSISLPVVDLAGLAVRIGESEAGRLAASEARRPFDLEAGPLLRTTLLRLSGEDHRLLLTMHHAVSDGWSLGVLLRELSEGYRGVPLPPLAVQYSDFSAWQREWLSGERLEGQLALWRERLAGREGAAELPSDRPRPAVASLRGARESLPLPEGLLERVERAGRQHGATPFVTLLAAFQALVHRVTGLEDLVIGSPVAGRPRPEVEGLIGLFVNLLPLRVRVDGALSLAALLERTREAAVSALEHQDVPFERLVAELEPERDLSRHPVFQLVLVVEDAPAASSELEPGLVLAPIEEVPTGTAKLDLTLALTGSTLEARYATDLFDAATMRRLLGHFRNLLQGIAADGEARVAELPLLDAGEREQVLVAWNRTECDIPEEPVHRLFFQWADRTPDAPAVVWEDGSLTYAELASRAEVLAERLRKQGVGPETLVALCLERSPELLTAALAVLEAGGAYLPIDPAYPEERRNWILADSGAAVVLDPHPRPLSHTHSRPPGRGGMETADLAYVIYTSGSTGTPKGTELRHRGLSSLIAWHRRTFGVGPADRASLVAGPGFDASVWEIWAALTSGVPLYIPPRDLLLSPASLVAWMAERRITLSFLPTPLAEAVLAEPVLTGLALRLLFVGGDRLRRRPAPGLPFEVVNLYGPTETTVIATAARIAPSGAQRPPEIGLPIDNTRTYVLDRGLQPMPIGAPGELCLAGEGLARGYRGRPELTAERFVPDPFGTGGRLYRTGDLARWLPSGELEFLGRLDHQVKIRGFRIELGEIEAVLSRHPAVREAAVLAQDGRLVAYVAAPEMDLRSFLAASLPDAMVPTGWVFLESLPLTANGKVDRRALAALDVDSEPESGEEARTPLEELVAGLFAQILGLDRAVGRNEDFFQLGGHSLLAARLASRVREVCGVEVGLRSVFEHSTAAELAAVVAGRDRVDGPPLVPLPRGGGVPLSFAQQRLWFLESFQPGTALYNLPQVWDLRGPLSLPKLEEALGGLVRRHESLRTVFTAKGQVVRPAGSFPLPLIEESALEEEIRRPFDLQEGPLFRAALVRLGEEEHRLLLSMHHIVSDGASIDVLARELSLLYRGETLPPLPVQYADFSVWQRSWLQGDVLERHLAWWRERLAGAPVVLELPTDWPRPAAASFAGATERLCLGDELDAAIARVARLGGATFFMTALAAFQALLHRYTGQDDLLVGSPVAGRDRRELEGMVGFFVNLVPLRAVFAGDLTFDRLLGATREAALGAFAHQEVPFERLVEELAPERDLSRAPLVQALLLVQGGAAVPDLPGVEASPVRMHPGTAKFDLTVSLDRSHGIHAQVEYAASLFEAATARRLLGHFRTLLGGIVADTGMRVSELPLLEAAEREQVLTAWNRTEYEIPDEPVHRLFFHWAERTPDAPAIVWDEGSLTYGELAERVDRLAHHLRGQGVGPETLVALCLERSPELVTAALAVLEAGGAYLPIDPAHPEERRAWILADSGAALVIRDRALVLDVPDVLGVLSGSDLAYVIYTSGSTGTPKGTELRHRGLSSLIAWHRRTYGLGPSDRTTLLAGPGFDASVWETWAPLTSGASLHIPPRDVVLSPAALLAWMADHGITVSFLPTPLAEAILAEPLPKGLALRSLLTGGDRLRRRPAPGLPFELVNHYGPTESTVVATAGAVSSEGERAPQIGSPIANTRVYLLDRELRPVPVGVAGELCLAGEGLARGYRGRPELTAERFVPDPFASGGRLYRTGDLARWLPSGEIEFLGRADHQVKIRGHRIELGEIEVVLARHPAVREAAVLARDGRLVAFVSLREAASLRDWLAERLPDFMIPSRWVFLDSLPLTPNGKVDRRALAGLDPGLEPEDTAAAPRNPVEELLATLFAEVLGLENPPSARDDFFHLGGHSLLAVQLATRVRAAFGVELPVRAVFEHPTVAGLAEALAGPSPAPSLVPVERTGSIPLSFAQERLWFLDRFELGTSTYNIPIQFRIRGEGLRIEALAAALAGVVLRHEALRTVFREGTDGQPEQIVLPLLARETELAVVDLSGMEDPDRRALELAELPFDLASGPLLRGVLLRVSGDDHRLVLSMHHVASDGWSIGVLVRELSALYLGQPLPEMPVQYTDYAVWQRGWLAGEVLEAELAWWRERLAGIPAGLDLPADRPRPPVQSYRGHVRSVAIDAEVLAALGRRCGATFFMTVLAAFDVFLHRITHVEDLVVGTPVANRDRAEVEGLVGFFVNTLVLRASLAGDPGFEELLARVRASALEAYAHQDLPFEKLVAELSPERDLSRHPLFQVSLSVQEGARPALDLGPGLFTDLSEVRIPTSKFDISLHLGRELAQIEYASDLFDKATIDRFLGCFRTLLAGIAQTPAARISELPLLTAAERGQLRLVGETTAPGRTLHGLVEEQARRAPGAVALVAADGRIVTYGELVKSAGSLAQRLRGLGVRAETRVALCADRSPELVIGLLGILEAGGACVPLDPGHLSERLSFVLEDSGALVLATTSALSQRLPAGVPRVLLDIHEDLAGPSLGPVEPEQIAYVIYTSGSTGRPKGVAVSHGDAAAHCETAIRLYGVHPGDRVLQFASPAFDVSLEEILTTLGAGAALVLRESMWDTGMMAKRVEELGITVLNLPSAVWHHWAHDAESMNRPSRLRLVVVGGEEVLTEPARQWLRSPLAEIPVLNGYGPTEAVITATLHEVKLDTLGTTGSVPIGRTLPGRSAIVLDPRGHPVPAGVSGELYLGGCLARGYLGRPGLTAERFVPDPFGEPGARLYRTGDLVRYRKDIDVLEFLGRIDQQIKIRGFRVEPAEIETALAAFPGVAAAAVLVHESGREKQLVAFVEPDGAQPSVDSLRSFLEARLPAWMVPAGFAVIDALPLNTSGKVDRAALARRPIEIRRAGSEAPRTEVEQALAAIWEEVLGVGSVGRADDFFHLGGHSLLAMRLASRVRARFGAGLELRDIFEAPTLAGQAARIAPESFRTEAGMEEPAVGEPLLVRVERGSEAPLSFAQERLWFLERLEPGTIAYNVPAVFHFRGPLRSTALAGALGEVVRRQEALRTIFREGADGVPVQVVQGFAPIPLPVVDLSGLPDPAVEASRLELWMARRPIDLARGPLLRAVLLRTSGAEHRLFLGLHHTIFDGWSGGVLERELAAAWQASILPELPVQYADYAVWQRHWLTGEVLAAELGWWRERLAGVPTVLTLPTDHPRPARRSFRGVHHRDALSAEVVSTLTSLGRSLEASPFMVFLAGYQALLARLSGADRLLVGTPIANRRHAEVEGLIGLFVNTLALPADLLDSPFFTVHLERTRDLLMGAFAHQDLPFERLVEELAPERDLSRTPLVQALIVLGGAPGKPVELAPGLSMEPRGLAAGTGTGTSKMDLSLHLGEAGDGSLAIAWEADADLFDTATLARISGWLRNLLEGLAAAPERAVREVSLLSEAERRQLQAWSGEGSREARSTVLERIVSWMERTPDAPSLAGTGEPLSWRELNLRSARLARRLRGLGAGPEARVAVCLERSPDLVVAILGVLRSGAAYVVLDPDQPPSRRKRILEGSESLALITRHRLVPDLDGLPKVRIEEVQAEDGRESQGAPDLPEPSNLAYVLYTSGSTGEPKGVAIEHRQLASYVAAVLERLDLPEGSSFATVTTFAADLGHTSVFGALASGGTLHVVPRELSADPARLASRFAAYPVDALKIVPSHLAALLAAAPRPERVLPRRRLVVGGEAATWELIGRVRELAPGCRILNHYGPTETTVGVLTAVLKNRSGDRPPLGRPLPGNLVRLLDTGLEPVPVGVPGEVWIGGAQVARGYLGQPDRTAERFLPDPYGEPGARLYRTGDLARWLPSGDLEFLGRADDQLKVRGHRVEPGEIAAVLARHPAVSEAAVLPVERAGEVRLGACVVPKPGADVPARGELRSWLATRLPEPMIPSEIILLDALPLTPNGKIDRWALRTIMAHAEAVEAEPVQDAAPTRPAEELLARLFAELLGRERVTLTDDFFELGGHSLLAVRLLARVREVFGVELDVRSVFERRTVAGLAARVEELLRGEEETGMAPPPLLPHVTGYALSLMGLPLSFAQERLWFLDRLEPGRATYNVVRELRLRGPLYVPALDAALAEAVHRHEPLRTRFEAVDGEPVQIVLPFAAVPLPLADLSALPEPERHAETMRLAALEGQRPFDLRRGPMLRAALLRLTAEEHVLLLGVHHIAFDGWSLDVLRRELGALYTAFAAGKPSPLAPLPVRYADYAVWQRQWLQGEVLESQLAWWRERLAGSPPALELPFDRPRPEAQSLRGAVERAGLPRGLFEGRGGATPFMTLLAGVQAFLHRITGQDGFLVGTPVANRDRAEIQGLIGFFVNTLVLRADLSGDPTFPELLARVRETALSAYAHQDLPFERLVQELAPGRDLARTPLFQVVFSWQPPRAGSAELAPGLGLEIADIDSGTSKFDLSLFVGESREGAGVAVEYAADLFDRVTIRRLVGNLARLLEGITAEGGDRVPVSALPLMGEEERAQVIRQWNDTATDYPRSATIHGLFEEQARRYPRSVAVVCGEVELTYSELDLQAERIASRLLAMGVRPDAAVGLCAERSTGLIAALLGILKAGGAYLPLDPQYPGERLACMLADAGARVLVVEEGLEHRLPMTGAAWLPLHDALATEAGTLPRSRVDPCNLAYVLFTSGSTGRPKGVAVTHRNVVRLVRETDYLSFGPEEVFLQFAPVSFDASTLEIWGPLLNGGQLAVFPPGPPDLRLLGEAVERYSVTSLWLTAGLFQQMIESHLPRLRNVRQLAAGGDVLSPDHVRRALAGLPGITLVNGYGPTEGTTFTCCYRIGGRGIAPAGSIPIGRPISNTQVYLLDGALRPVPVGVVGQLYAAGDGLARGYAGRPDLTAERFVPDPVSGEPGARLYATGDLARWLAGGEIEFLGRADQQVKIRGYRIELGEIEAMLAAHPEVETAVVLARDDMPGDRRLVAYAVPRPEQALDVAELRGFLAIRLPAYMVPAAFELLPGLPLTVNGKVDRRALPAPGLSQGGAEPIPPRTPLEREVAQIWREVLGVERIGVDDNFWELGGHSLLATKVLSRLCDSLSLDLPLQSLFEAPTLAGFAQSVGHRILASSGTEPELGDLLDELEGLSQVELQALIEEETRKR
jgi:amino acid adenylation domain-containing protein